jgi:WD40 repeat protein/serine/threonine protein kinase/Tfp pilus assembly protein PilF
MKSPGAQIDEVFCRASQLASAEERNAYLDQACEGQPRLRAEVEKLLWAAPRAEHFLERPFATPAAIDQPITEKPGTLIGRYKLLEQIGEGGMGLVFMARQQEPVKRNVALKVIKPGMDTRQVIARFEAERQALALMDHPNIARVLDAGSTESGRPYFVMDLVKGIPVTEYCDRERLSTRQRLELFVPICRAVQHAHQKGIIHRDLKPSNVLVTLHDGTPVPKIIDFGVAKATGGQLTDRSVVTGFAQMIGTPLYMSPEQAQMSELDVDTRSDVYSLGVLLYELLTGTTPFERAQLREAAYGEMCRIIREEEPPRPSARLSTLGQSAATVAENRHTDSRTLTQQVRGDLDWIVMKALQKDRTRRYESAAALARDVQRYLTDEPVEARPPRLADRVGKWVRRHRAAVWSAAVTLLMVTFGLTVSTILVLGAYQGERDQRELAQQREKEAREERSAALDARQLAERAGELARQQERLAKQQYEISERNLYVAHMRLAPRDWEESQVGRLHKMLDSYIPEAGRGDLRGWEWYYYLSLCHGDVMTLRGRARRVLSVAWSPDGGRVASGEDDGNITVWDARTGKVSLTLREHAAGVWAVAWRPDGKRLASGCLDGTARIWDTVTGKRLFVFRGVDDIRSVAWTPDGRRLAVGGENTVKIWDAATGQEALALGSGETRPMALSPDGKRLAAGDCRIFDALTGRQLLDFGDAWMKLTCAWSPDGKSLAVGQWTNWARIFDPETGQCLHWLWHPGSVQSLAWSPDSKQLATASWAQKVTVWDAKTGKEEISLRGHRGRVFSVSWSPDGRRLASGGADGTLKIWDPRSKQEPLTVDRAGAKCLAWDPQGQRLASASGGKIQVWAPTTGKEVLSLDVPATTIAWGPNGRHLAAMTDDKAVILDIETRKELMTLPGGRLGYRPSGPMSWSPDGTRLAGWGPDKTLQVWHARAPADPIFHTEDVLRAVAWSPDGSRIATGEEGVVRIWDASTGKELLVLRGHAPAHWIFSVAWSPDGTRLASGGWDETVKVWDTSNGRELVTLRGHTGYVLVVGWTPDGKRLASASSDGTVRIWAPLAGQEVLSLAGFYLAWSPDGARLATIGGPEGKIRIYDASVGYALAGSPAYQAHVHEQKADEYLESGAVEKAIAEYGEAIRLDPKSPRACYARAQAYLKKGVFDFAAADLSKAIALAPDAADVWYLRALAQLRAGRADEYRKDCAEMLKQFGETQKPDEAHWAAWTCVLAPDATPEWPRVLALAEKAAKSDPKSFQYQVTLGAALYRAGRLEEAAQRLAEADRLPKEPSERLRSSPAYDWFFLAMAHWQLGQKDEARKWYDKAAAWMEQNKPKDADLLRFRAEAAELLGIEEKPPTVKQPAGKPQ